jgi:hypothetical protein
VFAADGTKSSTDAGTQLLGPPSRVTTNVSNLHPVEVLAVEESLSLPNKTRDERAWSNSLTSANTRISPTMTSLQLTPGSLWKPMSFTLNPGIADSKYVDTKPITSSRTRWRVSSRSVHAHFPQSRRVRPQKAASPVSSPQKEGPKR